MRGATYLLAQHWDGRQRQVVRARWLMSLAYWVGITAMGDPVSKSRCVVPEQ